MTRTHAAPLLISDLATAAGPGVPLAGIDLGEKTIGIAISDISRSVATPVTTLRRGRFGKDAEALTALFTERGVGGLVIGLPINMDGSEGPRCQSSRAWGRNLAKATGLPVMFWDERLSSVAAERALIDADMSRAKRAVLIDHVAASYILQGALDRLAHLARIPEDDR